MVSTYFRTFLFLAALTALFLTIGFLIGGINGAAFALIFAIATNFFSYWNSDKIVLSLYGAMKVERSNNPQLFELVEDLSSRAQLPMPKLYIIQNPQPNAFATGRNPENAAVAVHTGLMERLSIEELSGVIAHELAHIKNRDTLLMTITATIAGALSMLANFGMWFGGNRNSGIGAIGSIAMVILAPMAAMLVQMAISRTREYEADRIGALICGNPKWLVSALIKISSGAHEIINETAEENPATAHMFIINPLAGLGYDNLFSTHPDTNNRVAALEKLAHEMGQLRQSISTQSQQAYEKGPWG